MKGVVAFYSTRDIPGRNVFIAPPSTFIVEEEELFVANRVKFHGQPVGIIVATSNKLAHEAADLVRIQYSTPPPQSEVNLSIEDVIFKQIEDPHNMCVDSVPLVKSDVKNLQNFDIAGRLEIPSQYHFAMEPHTTICEFREDGMDVYCSSQGTEFVVFAVSTVLNWPGHKINCEIRRLGGSYGCKISRQLQYAGACALACYQLKRRVRFVATIEEMMAVSGKRYPVRCDYQVRVDPDGRVLTLSDSVFSDFGCSLNENVGLFTGPAIPNIYRADNWQLTETKVLTNTPSNTWTRSPGSLDGFAITENIMEHVAFVTQRDPMEVRIANLDLTTKFPQMLQQFLVDIEYQRRQMEIQHFNEANRWKKRGLGVAPIKHHVPYFGVQPAIVSIYNVDGTVSVTHAGVEMGQGLNTKVTKRWNLTRLEI